MTGSVTRALAVRRIVPHTSARRFANALRAIAEVRRTLVTDLRDDLWKVAASAGLLLLTAAPAPAQEPFASAQQILQPGDTVFVTDDGARETRGTVIRVGPSALRLAMNGTETEWTAAAVWRLERRGDSVTDGAARGVVT